MLLSIFYFILLKLALSTKIAIIHENKNETYYVTTLIRNTGIKIDESDILYIKSKVLCSTFDETNSQYDFIVLFETSYLNSQKCLIESLNLINTNLIIINDNDLMVSNLLNKNNNRKNLFVLNQDFIFNDILSVQLSKQRYYHLILLISTYSQFENIKDEISSYLKCNIYFKCSFELTFILLNQTCIQNKECINNEISLNLNNYLIIKDFNITTNQLYKNDAILFVLNGELNFLQTVYDQLLKFIYELSTSILAEYNNFDFLIINNNQNKIDLNKNVICEWFSSVFLNYLNNNLNKTAKRNYYEIRKIYYINKDPDQLQKLCSLPKINKILQSLFSNMQPNFSNKKFIADLYDGFQLLEFLIQNKNITSDNILDKINNLNYYCERMFNKFGSNENYNIKITNILQYNYNNNTCNYMVETFSKLKSNHQLFFDNSNLNVKNTTDTLIAVAVLDEPFLFLDSKGIYRGYCVDLLEVISKRLNIKYKIREAKISDYGSFVAYPKDTNGTIAYKWTGMMGELLNGEADLITGKFILNSIRDEFIDFSTPYYSDGGISLLIKRPKSVNSIFLFIEVFSYEVWICIIAIVIGTAFLMHIFERIRIYLSKKEGQYGQDDMQYSLSDSIWIVIGCFTLTGGLSPPRAISICILIASFWFLSAICISTYQANLSAFLTSSKLQTQISSVKDLLQQSNIEYSAIDTSYEQNLFKKLKNLELEFYSLWKNISLSGNSDFLPSDYIPSKAYAVYDYPLPDIYTRFWNNMLSSGWVQSLENGVERVLNSSNQLPYVLILDYPKAKYVESKKCTLMTLDMQFAQKSYAFGFPTGSPLKEKFTDVILDLKQNGVIKDLKNKWWTDCQLTNQETSSSITLDMVGGSFIMLGVGILLSLIVLFIQSMTLKSLAKKKAIKNNNNNIPLSDINHENSNGKLNSNLSNLNKEIQRVNESNTNTVSSNGTNTHLIKQGNATQYNDISNYLNENDLIVKYYSKSLFE